MFYLTKYTYLNFLILGIIFIFSTCISISQVSIPNIITAMKIDNEIKLDGILDEDCWKNAQIVSNFTQREQNEGEPVTERTEVAIVFTAETLYVGFWCYDKEPDNFVAKQMKRDFDYWTDDNFEVIFDTFNDDRNGYVFVVNPNGARADVLITNEGANFNFDWNGIWDAVVTQNDNGWFGEIAIPFSTLKFLNSDEQIWGVNFERNIRRKKEAAFWQGWSRNWDFENVSHAGTLLGLKGIKGKEILELKPFLTTGYSINSVNEEDKILKVGGDLNYLITPTLKLNLTTNTDFAQVESDQMQINLTRFSLYFPEKRDFFLEGKDFFEFNFSSNSRVFYSRRIGINEGREIPILAGVRLIGKQNSTNIGVLSIQTKGIDSIETANYSTIRIKHEILEKSSIGMILTGKNQGAHYNYVYGGDFNVLTSKFLGNNNLSVSGNFAHSITKSDTANNNFAYNVEISYPNDKVFASIYFSQIQNGFNPEMGFLRRTNFKNFSSNLRIRTRPSFLPFFHSVDFGPFVTDFLWTDNTNEMESYWVQIAPITINTKSGEYFQFSIERNFERLDNGFKIFENIYIPEGRHTFNLYNFKIGTFEGRSYYIYTEYGFGDFYNCFVNYIYTSGRITLGRHLNISTTYRGFDIKSDNNKFYANELGGRIEYAFHPKLNSSIYGQWSNDRNEILLNFRLHWIPVIGSDFYIAVNQFLSTNNNIIKLENTVLLAKLVWRFSI